MRHSTTKTGQLLITTYCILATFSFATEEKYDDCASPSSLTEMNKMIDAVLQTGGSYAPIRDANAYNDWPVMVDILDKVNAKELKVMPMPFGLELYQRACENIATPTFTMTPKNSGQIIASVKTFGNFHPNLFVNSKIQHNQGFVESSTRAIASDIYEIIFFGFTRKTYEINLNKHMMDRGLYSIEFFQ